jgi:hypothetical protein
MELHLRILRQVQMKSNEGNRKGGVLLACPSSSLGSFMREIIGTGREKNKDRPS